MREHDFIAPDLGRKRRGAAGLDLSGQTFGRLKAVDLLGSRNSRRFWRCICECGTEVEVSSTHLRSGHTKSCGCFQKDMASQCKTTHGQSRGHKKTRAYASWKAMRRRCNGPNAASFARYGGRGISICPEWDSFETFLADMGEPPPNQTLDRINVNGIYEPSNCRWATAKEQARNTRRSRLIEVGGETLAISAWAERLGVPYMALYARNDAQVVARIKQATSTGERA